MAQTPSDPLTRALLAHRTALAALGSFALKLSQVFGAPGSQTATDRYEMALRYAIETRQVFDTLVREAALTQQLRDAQANGNGHGPRSN